MHRHHGAFRFAGARGGAHEHVVARLVRALEHHALHPVQRRQALVGFIGFGAEILTGVEGDLLRATPGGILRVED